MDKHFLHIVMDRELIKQFKLACLQDGGKSMTEVLTMLIKEYLDERKGEE